MESSSTNPAAAAGAVPERSQHQQAAEAAAFWSHFTLKRLPWDVITCVTWLLACLLHVQLVLEAGPLRCTGSAGHVSAGLYQGHALASAAPSWLLPGQWKQHNSYMEPAGVSAGAHDQVQAGSSSSGSHGGSGQQPLLAAYPCSSPAPLRLAYMARHPRQLAAAAAADPVSRLLLGDPFTVLFMVLPVLHLLTSALILCSCSSAGSTRSTYSASSSSTGMVATQPGPMPAQAAAAAPAAGPHGRCIPAALLLPDWAVNVRTAIVVFMHLSGVVVLLLGLLKPPPAHLLPLTMLYSHSSVSGSCFWPVLAIHAITGRVSALHSGSACR